MATDLSDKTEKKQFNSGLKNLNRFEKGNESRPIINSATEFIRLQENLKK
jgi:hypothetical protein